jgi:hypothetical protein
MKQWVIRVLPLQLDTDGAEEEIELFAGHEVSRDPSSLAHGSGAVASSVAISSTMAQNASEWCSLMI